MSSLWQLREYAGRPAIAKQVREAIAAYLKNQENQIGCPIPDIVEAIEKHNYEQASDREQPKGLQAMGVPSR